jgi:26S proteasome regulatory subunit T2
MEEEFIQNQERLKPQEEKSQEERAKVDDLRGSPMGVGTLEEMIDDDHAIVSSSVGPGEDGSTTLCACCFCHEHVFIEG